MWWTLHRMRDAPVAVHRCPVVAGSRARDKVSACRTRQRPQAAERGYRWEHSPRTSSRRASGAACRHLTRRGGQSRGRSRVNASVMALPRMRSAAEARRHRGRRGRGRATSWPTARAGRGCAGGRCARRWRAPAGCRRPCAGAVAAADLASDDGGPDSLFGAPVGGVDRRVPQKGEDGREFGGQVRGEALGVAQPRRVVDQPAEPGEQSAARGGQTVVADTAGVAPVAQREAGLQGVLHVASPRAAGMVVPQMLTSSPQVLQTRLMLAVGEAPVHHPAVAHEHAVEVGPEEGLRVVESAACADGVNRRRRGDGRPQPVAAGADAPAGLIGRDHGRVADLLAQVFIGRPRVAGRTMQQMREARPASPAG